MPFMLLPHLPNTYQNLAYMSSENAVSASAKHVSKPGLHSIKHSKDNAARIDKQKTTVYGNLISQGRNLPYPPSRRSQPSPKRPWRRPPIPQSLPPRSPENIWGATSGPHGDRVGTFWRALVVSVVSWGCQTNSSRRIFPMGSLNFAGPHLMNLKCLRQEV